MSDDHSGEHIAWTEERGQIQYYCVIDGVKLLTSQPDAEAATKVP